MLNNCLCVSHLSLCVTSVSVEMVTEPPKVRFPTEVMNPVGCDLQ